MAVSVFTELCNHHHHQFSNTLITLPQNPTPISFHPLSIQAYLSGLEEPRANPAARAEEPCANSVPGVGEPCANSAADPGQAWPAADPSELPVAVDGTPPSPERGHSEDVSIRTARRCDGESFPSSGAVCLLRRCCGRPGPRTRKRCPVGERGLGTVLRARATCMGWGPRLLKVCRCVVSRSHSQDPPTPHGL